MKLLIALTMYVVLLVGLVACGGGGGGGADNSHRASNQVITPQTVEDEEIIEDDVPDDFILGRLENVELNTAVMSEEIAVSGVNTEITVSVDNGEYSVDGGEFTSDDGVVNAGQTITVRQISAGIFETEKTTVLSLNNVSSTFVTVTKADINPPTAKITFPPDGALITDYPAGALRVRGTYEDIDGDEVTSVTVNGIEATLYGDSTWLGLVDVSESGILDLSVNVVNVGLNQSVDVDRISIKYENDLPKSLVSVALDSAGKRLLVLDSERAVLMSVDIREGSTYGEMTLLSGNGAGLGPDFEQPMDVVLDEMNSRALVIDQTLEALFAVDLSEGETLGDRIILSSSTMGTGHDMEMASSLALDTNNSRVYVLSQNSDLILSVDLSVGATLGNRSTIVDDSAICDSAYVRIGATLDSDNNRLLLACNNRIEAIDLTVGSTFGDRSIISDDSNGAGLGLDQARSIVFDPDNSRAYTLNSPVGQLIEVDLVAGATFGDRKEILPRYLWEARTHKQFNDIVLDKVNNQVYIVDAQSNEVYAVNLKAGSGFGDIVQVTNNGRGKGSLFSNIQEIILDKVNNRMLVLDQGYSIEEDAVIISVDLTPGETLGNRTIISGADVGSGVSMLLPSNMDYDAANNRLLVIDGGFRQALFAVDLTPGPTLGNRTILSDENNGVGNPIQYPQGLTYDATGNRALFTSENTGYSVLYEIDLEPGLMLGDRNVVSAPARFDRQFRDLIIDTENSRVLIADVIARIAAADLTVGADFGVLSNLNIGYGSTSGFAWDRKDNFLYGVRSAGEESIYVINMNTGQHFTVSNNSFFGPKPDAHTLAIDEDEKIIYAVDATKQQIIATTEATRDRVVISR